MAQAQLHAKRGARLLCGAGDNVPHLSHIVGMQHPEGIVAEHVLRPVPQDPRQRGARVAYNLVTVHNQDDLGGVLHQGTEAFFALP